MARSYRMTPARKAALKKAQIASARKRKGKGRGRVSAKSRLRAAGAQGKGLKKRSKPKSTANRRRLRRGAALVGAVGAVAGAGYVYKNREKLIISKVAEYGAVRNAQRRAGRKLTKNEIRSVRLKERQDHASRSTYRVREYRNARKAAQMGYRQLGVSSLRPDRANSLDKVLNRISGPGTMSPAEGRYTFMAYRRDVYSRAVQRLNRMKGKKRGFNYDSGKRLRVDEKGKVTRAWV